MNGESGIGPIGVNTYPYAWTTPAEDAVRRLAAQGYRAFEFLVHPPHLPLDGFDAAARRRLARSLDEVGATDRLMNVPSLDHNLASPLARMRTASVAMFRDALDIASDIGVDRLVVVPGRLSPLAPASMADRTAWMRQAVETLLPYAEQRGVSLLVENVPMASFPDAASLGAFVRGFGSERIGICYDAANAHFIGESPAEGIRELADLIRVIHLSDTGRTAWRHDRVGTGDVPFAEVAAALDAVDFGGPCILEILDPEPEAHILQSHDALANQGFAPRRSPAR